MATGTGKTRTAIRILRQLFETGQIDTVIVAADGNDLLAQWRRELLAAGIASKDLFTICREHGEYHERDAYLIDPSRVVLLTSRPALPATLRGLPRAAHRRLLLIHDEVHRLGSPGNVSSLRGLSDAVTFRLGLSATPEREYDLEGTQFIEDHVGPVIFQFDLAQAIRRRILSPFEYVALPYVLSPDDRAALQQVHKRAAARQQAGNPMSPEEIWIDLARVYKTSLSKLAPFEMLLAQRPEVLERCLVFVETREYGGEVLRIIHRVRTDFHAYFEGEDSTVLQRFARGELECLVTCHRLSEGIDIRSTRGVVLFASSRGRLETIQRIGRCLRVDPLNPGKRAIVVDFIRPTDPLRLSEPDEERRLWLEGLSQVEPEKE
jgi:superfamily II DNA or RNA helicase